MLWLLLLANLLSLSALGGDKPQAKEILSFALTRADGSEEMLTQANGHLVPEPLFGDAVTIRLSGFPADHEVTVRATSGAASSFATFLTDAGGRVDLATQAPLRGSYQGSDRDGLFWSLATPSAPDIAHNIPIRVTFTASVDGNAVASATLQRGLRAPGVNAVVVEDDGLEGQFFIPAGKGPFPAVLVLGGSEGGIATAAVNAAYLASRGYAALALAYFAYRHLPAQLELIPLEYFGKAIAWLRKRPEVRPEKLAVWGPSRGGELALLLGATFPELKAVIGVVPSGVIWGNGADEVKDAVSSWTLHGRPLPFLEGEFQKAPTVPIPGGGSASVQAPVFAEALKAPADVARATIPVERTQGPLLMLAGSDDKIWPSCQLSQIAWDRLQAQGHPYPDRRICYPNAGHGLDMPLGLSTMFPYLQHPLFKIWLALGGTPSGIAAAQRDASEQIERFLAQALR